MSEDSVFRSDLALRSAFAVLTWLSFLVVINMPLDQPGVSAYVLAVVRTVIASGFVFAGVAWIVDLVARVVTRGRVSFGPLLVPNVRTKHTRQDWLTCLLVIAVIVGLGIVACFDPGYGLFAGLWLVSFGVVGLVGLVTQ